MTGPRVLVLHASGTNRDAEAARAFELAGGVPEICHVNQLRCGSVRMDEYSILVVPGGFSHGDALGAGNRLALDLQSHFADQLHRFVDSGRLVLGICNGFQVLVKSGLLAGPTRGSGAGRRVTLTDNERGRFECRWIHLEVDRRARATFLGDLHELILCPVAHGEGRFLTDSTRTLAELEDGGRVAFRYVDRDGRRAGGRYPTNPNGSHGDIAGICNEAGNVLGLMPHPEDHVVPAQRPFGPPGRLGSALFEAMVRAS